MTKNTKKYIIIFSSILLISCLIVTGIYIYNAPYLSITLSEYTDSSRENIITSGYCCNTVTRSSKKVFSFRYTAQYPLMTYDKAENKAYYVKKPPNQHRDEIYAYDMKTGKTSQLTTDLFSVNIILPVKDRIFFAGRGIDMKNLRLGAIDKSTGAITYWKDDGDTNVWSFSVDDEKQKIYMSTFSTKERFVNIHLPEFVQETNIIYETDYNFQNTKQLYSKEHEWYRMVMANGDHLLILHSVAGTGTTEPIYLNLETGQTDEFTLPDTVIHQGTAFFSKNGKYLYFSGYNASVYRYNIYTKKTKCIFTAPEGAYINNFVLYQ